MKKGHSHPAINTHTANGNFVCPHVCVFAIAKMPAAMLSGLTLMIDERSCVAKQNKALWSEDVVLLNGQHDIKGYSGLI